MAGVAYTLNILPAVFFTGLFAFAAVIKFAPLEENSEPRWRRFCYAAVLFRVLYAALKTWVQYYIWRAAPAAAVLTSPSYFASYALSRFWLNAALSVGAAFIFYLFLLALRRYRERFFEAGETELGLLLALITGWPGIILFLPMALLLVVLLSILRLSVRHERLTTLGLPMFIAAALALFLGGYLGHITNLWVLQV